ncbi:MAG TPA: MgtC/SapB family protein [Verrucomicrobiae bacterium]|nr:MgtC/SapB family protein [Verrucomicrobiae bacterium]
MNAPLTYHEILLRILAATVAGIVVGLERETRGRPAGLRTTILACVASAISMVVSESLFVDSGTNTAWRPDPARLGAGILTGIGFLGAGTIMRNSDTIRGVTTAASLWFVTVLGLAFGTGLYFLGFIGLVIALISLGALPALEKLLPVDWYSTLTVIGAMDSLSERDLRGRLIIAGLKPKRVKMRYDLEAQKITVSVEVQFNRKKAPDVVGKIVQDLRSLPGIQQIRWS